MVEIQMPKDLVLNYHEDKKLYQEILSLNKKVINTGQQKVFLKEKILLFSLLEKVLLLLLKRKEQDLMVENIKICTFQLYNN
jgi:hypothetical protein